METSLDFIYDIIMNKVANKNNNKKDNRILTEEDLKIAIDKGLDDVINGRVISIEESKAKLL